ncbi:MAG TPA: hypothetical protein VNW92_20755 [Polyangiaceae bacterium]|jgi:hypothetical protein|nr:hypothetical protein [Polyangiaceae bacterium]
MAPEAPENTLVEVLDAMNAEFGEPDEAARAWAKSVLSGSPNGVEALSQTERAWLIADEKLWQRAHRIVAGTHELDVGDVYHTLRNFQRSPAERLRRGLRHGRASTRTK